MKKFEIFNLLKNYKDTDEITEFERREDAPFLRKELNEVTHTNLIQTIALVILSIVILPLSFLSYKQFIQSKVLTQSVSLKNGKLEEQTKLIQEKDKDLSITRQSLDELKRNDYYNRYASAIVDYYYNEGVPVKFGNIRDILRVSDEIFPKYFISGKPFTLRDIRALAMYESNFNLRKKGNLGEIGAWQIYDIKWACDFLGISSLKLWSAENNCSAACYILKQKYLEHKDYQMAIIGYNGIVKTKDGKVKQGYWTEFVKCREILRQIEKTLK